MNITIIEQEEKTIKDDKGIFYGVSNYTRQSGKICTFYDRDSIVCQIKLDLAFFGVTLDIPGMWINLNFVNSLRCVTDGKIAAHWY